MFSNLLGRRALADSLQIAPNVNSRRKPDYKRMIRGVHAIYSAEFRGRNPTRKRDVLHWHQGQTRVEYD